MINTVKTTVLLAALTGLLVFVGRALAGPEGMVLALCFAAMMNLGSWWYSDQIVLRMYRARELSPAEAPKLHRIVAELAERARIPMPRVYLVPGATPNAFATGRDPAHAAVAVTEGLLSLMPPDELRGVLAHELAHVKNRDTLTAAVAAVAAGAISVLANLLQWSLLFGSDRREGRGEGLLTVLLAPLVATLIQLAISRSREFAADEFSARLLGDGRPLARALQRLEAGNEAFPAEVEPATAHLFIVSPLGGAGGVFSLFRTHPRTEERVARLDRLTAQLARDPQRYAG